MIWDEKWCRYEQIEWIPLKTPIKCSIKYGATRNLSMRDRKP
jgi:hypothetical protein